MLLPVFLFLLAPPEPESIEMQLKRFTQALAIIEEQAADPVSTEQAIYGGAIPGMLRKLDPFSSFFDPNQFEQLKQLEKSVQKGFGTVVSVLPGRVIVLQVVANTPSARAGVSPGDEIIGINNVPLAGLEPEQLIGLLSQARQMQIVIAVRRPGNVRIQQFQLTPENVDSPSVDRAFLVQPNIGMIRIASFDEKTSSTLHDSIEQLGGNKLKGLILDMRTNPGGLVPAALETASFFLEPGQRIFSVRGRNAKEQNVDVPKGSTPYRFPVAILVNEKTASAAEIVTGALQDHDRATVIGEPSFGKGLVQSVYPLGAGAAVALTTAFYYTPSGRSIQKPIADSALGATTTAAATLPEYKTAKGKSLKGGGGIQPDFLVSPDSASRFRQVLELSGSFAQYATELIRRAGKVDEHYTVTPETLDQFRLFLSDRNIQPGLAEWSVERNYMRSRLQQEVFNQTLGVAKGDELEAQRDPAVLKALDVLGS